MSDLDRDYLEQRRRESLDRAATAADPAIAHIHRQFATEYARKLGLDEGEPIRVVIGN